jgi:hypothetical protein
MADTLETTAAGGAKSTILRLIRPSTPAINPETAALRAEVEGLRLALSIAQEALREERSDKEHWRDEAKQLRQLLTPKKPEPQITLAPEDVTSQVAEAPTLVPAETEPADRVSPEMATKPSAESTPFRWWGRLFA